MIDFMSSLTVDLDVRQIHETRHIYDMKAEVKLSGGPRGPTGRGGVEKRGTMLNTCICMKILKNRKII